MAYIFTADGTRVFEADNTILWGNFNNGSDANYINTTIDHSYMQDSTVPTQVIVVRPVVNFAQTDFENYGANDYRIKIRHKCTGCWI